MWKTLYWNPATCSCKNGKYLASIIDNSVITCDEIIGKETKTVTTNLNQKNEICKTKKFLIFTWLFINDNCIINAISIYYHSR